MRIEYPSFYAKCLEGTTERSDSNRGRSPRKERCMYDVPGRHYAIGRVLKHRHRRTATSLRFSAALGIARTSSALSSLARKFQAAEYYNYINS